MWSVYVLYVSMWYIYFELSVCVTRAISIIQIYVQVHDHHPYPPPLYLETRSHSYRGFLIHICECKRSCWQAIAKGLTIRFWIHLLSGIYSKLATSNISAHSTRYHLPCYAYVLVWWFEAQINWVRKPDFSRRSLLWQVNYWYQSYNRSPHKYLKSLSTSLYVVESSHITSASRHYVFYCSCNRYRIGKIMQHQIYQSHCLSVKQFISRF